MKRIIAILLALVLVLGMTACGNSGAATSSKNVTELVLWGHQEEAWNASYQKIADEFMAANPDIKINYLNKGWGDSLNEALMTGLNNKGDAAPDIVVGEQYVKTFIDNGNFSALDLGDIKDDIVDQAKDYMIKKYNYKDIKNHITKSIDALKPTKDNVIIFKDTI